MESLLHLQLTNRLQMSPIKHWCSSLVGDDSFWGVPTMTVQYQGSTPPQASSVKNLTFRFSQSQQSHKMLSVSRSHGVWTLKGSGGERLLERVVRGWSWKKAWGCWWTTVGLQNAPLLLSPLPELLFLIPLEIFPPRTLKCQVKPRGA